MKFPLIGGQAEGRATQINAAIMRNWFLAVDPDSISHKVVAYGTHGLKTGVSVGTGEVRGLYSWNGKLYAVVGNQVYKDVTGTPTSIGSLTTTVGRVAMVHNSTATAQSGKGLIIADGTQGYIWNDSTFTQITDADFPNGTTHLTFINQRIIAFDKDTQSFFYSDLADASTWQALNFQSAERLPDDITALIADGNNNVWFLGPESVEIKTDTGDSNTPFVTFADSSTAIGIIAPHSLARVKGVPFWLDSSKLISSLQGNVTPPGLAEKIAKYTNVDDAFAFSFEDRENVFYVITFPTEGVTHVLNQTTGWKWHEWTYWNNAHERHRANCYAKHDGRHYVGDYSNGKVYELDMDTYKDDGSTIVRDIIGGPLEADGKWIFPSYFQVDTKSGVGNSDDENPHLQISFSKDGGHTYGNELLRPMGKVGEYTRRTIVNRIGRTRSFTVKARLSSPVEPIIKNAYLEAQISV